MKTVKFILVFLFVFININAIGQSVFVKGGLSLSRVAYTNNEVNEYFNGKQPKLGLHLGATYENRLSDMFFVELSPMLHWKGVTEVRGVFYGDKINVVCLDIPILFKGYFELNDNILIYNTFGPYLGLGLFGEDSIGDVSWGNDHDNNFERLDFGLSLGAGVDFNGTQVGVAYDFSLLNNNTDQGWYIYRYRVVRLSLSYKLRRKEGIDKK